MNTADKTFNLADIFNQLAMLEHMPFRCDLCVAAHLQFLLAIWKYAAGYFHCCLHVIAEP